MMNQAATPVARRASCSAVREQVHMAFLNASSRTIARSATVAAGAPGGRNGPWITLGKFSTARTVRPAPQSKVMMRPGPAPDGRQRDLRGDHSRAAPEGGRP